MFVIKKKSGKWRLVDDLRQINAVMATMGVLQPGLPSPTMIPMDWKIIVMDLKDCFFTLPLAGQEKEKFAFTAPTINHCKPTQRYQWKFLPQGMKNSPTICQWFGAQAWSPGREKFPDCYCYHYMDDILLAAKEQEQLTDLQSFAITSLKSYGLCLAPGKIQTFEPWKYLGLIVSQNQARPQKIQLQNKVKNLTDVQKLMGSINWIRPSLGLMNSQLQPLLEMLKGSDNPTDVRVLSPEALSALEKVEKALRDKFVSRIDLTQVVQVFILIDKMIPFGILVQWNGQWKDPLHILEWLFLPFRPVKTDPGIFELIAEIILKARKQCAELLGRDREEIALPVQNWYFQWCLANN